MNLKIKLRLILFGSKIQVTGVKVVNPRKINESQTRNTKINHQTATEGFEISRKTQSNSIIESLNQEKPSYIYFVFLLLWGKSKNKPQKLKSENDLIEIKTKETQFFFSILIP